MRINNWRMAIFAGAAVSGMLAPIVWLMLTSLKGDAEIFGPSPTFFPREFTVQNYLAIFGNDRFVQYGLNSLIVSIATTIGVTVLAIPAGYGFSKFFVFKGQTTGLVGVLIARMLPPIAIVIPLYMVFSEIGLLDTLRGLTAINIAIALPLAIWMFVVFFDATPGALAEAAMVDGCSKLQVLRYIILPLAKATTSSVMIITFLTSWNLFIIPLIFSSSASAKTLPVAISELAFGEYGTAWGQLAALSTVMLVPIVLLAISAQRYLAQGLTTGASKG